MALGILKNLATLKRRKRPVRLTLVRGTSSASTISSLVAREEDIGSAHSAVGSTIVGSAERASLCL